MNWPCGDPVRACALAIESEATAVAFSAEPAWFARSIDAVLGQAGCLLTADGPRELEQMTAELLGAELHRLASDNRLDLWVDRWFGRLVGAAAKRSRRWAVGADMDRSAWWLSHGLAAINPSPTNAAAALDQVTTDLPRRLPSAEPDWLTGMREIAATGEVWLTADSYGARFAVIAGFRSPGDDSFVFLFDVDASGLIDVVTAGSFGDVDEGYAAWRAAVGADAGDEPPHVVRNATELRCLVQCELPTRTIAGIESRATLDNWFRVSRRFNDLMDVFRARDDELPARLSLFNDIDPSELVGEFVDWYEARHSDPIDLAAVDGLAVEWLEGSLPGTVHAISLDRVAFKRALLDDWIADDPVTVAAKRLFPTWVCWLGLRAGLAEPLITKAVAAAAVSRHR